MKSGTKIKVWGIIGGVSALIWGVFFIAMTPNPEPVDEQLEAFTIGAKANDNWHNAALLHRIGEYDKAEKLYDEALKTLPDNEYIWLLRGQLEYDRGDYAKAITVYDEFLTIRPDFSWTLNARGIAKYKNGDKEGCMADLNRALELDPTYLGPLLNKGVIRRLEGDLDGALKLVTEAINADPDAVPDRLLYENLAEIYFQQGNFEESKKALDTIITFHPEYFPAYRNRARVLRELGQTQQAQQDEATYQTTRKAFEDSVKKSAQDLLKDLNATG